MTKLFNIFRRKKSPKAGLFDYVRVSEFLDMVARGNACALFLPIGKYTEVADQIVTDLYNSNDEANKRYAALLLGFVEGSRKNLFVNAYWAEKEYYDSLPEDDCRMRNSHQVIENLVISTAIRFDLGYQRKKRLSRLGTDWINFLFEVVSDAMNGYQWSAYKEALSILAFHFYKEEWLKVLLSRFDAYITQTTGEEAQANRRLYDEIIKRNGESEVFENLLNDAVIPKINEATSSELSNHEKELLSDLIVFLK